MWVADKLVYQNESDFIRAYKGSELVWELPLSSGLYYIRWSPSNLSGSFTLFGQTYNMQDYMGYYYWKGSGFITSLAFQSTGITEITTNVSIIHKSAFANCSSLSMATLPECNIISNNVFYKCSNLEKVQIPHCRGISSSAFYGCNKLSSIKPSYCKYIGNSAFYNCDELRTISLYDCNTIGDRAFESCSYVRLYLYKDGLTTGGYNMFSGVPEGNVNVGVPPDLYSQYKSAQYWSEISLTRFAYGYDLTYQDTIKAYQINKSYLGYLSKTDNSSDLLAFETNARAIRGTVCSGCSNLSLVKLDLCSVIASKYVLGSNVTHSFENCPALRTLYIYTPVLCTLELSNAFSYISSIYVPWFLVDKYKSAKNWSKYSNKIFAIPS